jgi:hypothetical protein
LLTSTSILPLRSMTCRTPAAAAASSVTSMVRAWMPWLVSPVIRSARRAAA